MCKKKSKKFSNKNGVTIIETMISVAIFLIVIMTGMGSILNANSVRNKSQDMRSVIDNLSFIMDDMSRNIRTGYNYRCISSGVIPSPGDPLNTPQNCSNNGWGFAFESPTGDIEDNTDQQVYYFSGSNLYKSTNGGSTATQLNPSEIQFQTGSGFVVTGAPVDDNQQPMIIMRLVGKIHSLRNGDTNFSLQTSVSQRLADVNNQTLPGYDWCADEWGVCNFPYANGTVIYGANSVFIGQSFSGAQAVPCNNTNFGDPIPGVEKACYMKSD